MTSVKQIARHFREVYFGGNWTAVNLKDVLEEVTWQQAITQVYHLNSIAALVFHIHYYLSPALNALQGKPLNAHDRFSFDLPGISSDEDWQQLVTGFFADAESFAQQIEQIDETKLFEDFAGASRYGNYYRNLFGIIEHTHYHLGQIVLIKKIIKEMAAKQAKNVT